MIWEIIGEMGLRGAEHVTFEEFRVIMELIRTREGFPGRVVDFYKEAFAKFDRDESGTMDREELADCLRWLGYSFDDDTVDAMMYEVDRGTSKDGLTWHSFLVCMRKFREREVAHMEQILTTVDKDGSGTINSVEEVQQLLQHLGYFPNSQAIREATEDAGLLKQSLMKRQAPSASQITQQHLVDMGPQGRKVPRTPDPPRSRARPSQDGRMAGLHAGMNWIENAMFLDAPPRGPQKRVAAWVWV